MAKRKPPTEEQYKRKLEMKAIKLALARQILGIRKPSRPEPVAKPSRPSRPATVMACRYCANEFMASSRTRKFCSKECYTKWHREIYIHNYHAQHPRYHMTEHRKLWLKNHKQGLQTIVNKVCGQCGKAFNTNHKRNEYCSDACRKEMCRIKQRSKTIKRTCVCMICKATFMTANATQKTCGPKCREEWEKERAEQNYHRYKPERRKQENFKMQVGIQMLNLLKQEGEQA